MIDSRVLVVDDERELLDRAERLLSKEHTVKLANSVAKARAILLQDEIDVAVVDLNFEGQDEDGIALLDFISKEAPEVEVVVLSQDREIPRIVDAMRRNLVDFVPKAGEYGTTLKLAVARGLEKKRQRQARMGEHVFLTNSPRMRPLLRTVHKISMNQGQFPVLILGETGTGKEVLAKYLAKLLGKPIVAANMASIPRETAESELFGHTRGAFTGAVANKPGLIEQAHGGIFFLDELGECSPAIQAKLLRVIQEKELQPVGSPKTKKIDVRFFAATNKDLDEMVAQQTFRMDLLQRLNTIPLRIPALRDRPEDVVLYANQFLAEFSGEKAFSLTGCGMDALMSHTWPGNVRELRNTMERLVVLADRRVIDGDSVQSALGAVSAPPKGAARLVGAEVGRAEILEVLGEESGNRTRAAARFGVHTTTFQRWLKKLGIKGVFKSQPGRPTLVRPVKGVEEVRE